jgi:hypothetical protein
VVARPESFFVDKQNRLLDGEEDRAVAWAEQLASQLMLAGSTPTGAKIRDQELVTDE